MFDPPSQANEKKESESNGFQSRAPALSLPKGGGAIRGMGEKFAANPVTGTGSMSVPIAVSPGRSGFGPQLSLSYDSGAGNGWFGFGWSLSLPSITRKTDKGLPRYRDAEESDEFILSGTEDLVPVLVEQGGEWVREVLPPRLVHGQTYRIQRYRPRIEGLFARIERWTNQADPKDTFWRSISKDNITTWYGKTEKSRIADPADLSRIFSWLICESYDDKGNVIVYGYKEENSDDIALSQVHERNRTDETRKANRYLKRIRYGNHTPYLPQLSDTEPWPIPPGATAVDGSTDWRFEVVLDYGEHHADVPSPNDTGLWKLRNDPFSSYRAGFEVRTYRLCQRVLMFHHFAKEDGVGADCLVRSTDFTYSYEDNEPDPRDPIFSFLLSTTQTGYKREPGGYLSKSLPPLEFEYTQPIVQEEIHEVDPESLENLPYGLDNGRYQWVDLDGEGLSGVLTEQAEGWFYKRNLSPIKVDGEETVSARFAPLERVAERPSLAAITSGRQQLLDLAGDGALDLVDLEGPAPGFYERTHDERWESFAPFTSLPVLDWNNPNLKFVDLTGDGHADILISEDEVFCWHPSLAEAGFGPPETMRKALDEEKGPGLVFADGTQSIYLADLSGDGLTDLVRIRNGEVCYWPNLGYGRFGAKVTMDNAPWFEAFDLFDQRRIRLADIDGSGVTDIIYLGYDGVHLYFNQSGNSWSDARRLVAFPAVDSLSSVQVADLFGNGTACLVWSSSLPGDTRRSMRYLDLMGGQKPHLLIKSVNNLGAETVVQYAPSTKFYLTDKLAGKPWITRLPFPVHCVERVETHDRISRNRFVTRSAYHHGYFDGVEREFRGFGMVEQWDTEEFAALSANDTLAPAEAAEGQGEAAGGTAATNIDAASHVPPVRTVTWFHTGAYLDGERISKQFEHEYYREGDLGLTDSQLAAMLLPDTALPAGLTAEEEREACRALKGSILRVEIYAEDGRDESDRPYTVSERNYTIDNVQPRGQNNRRAVFFVHPRETIDFHYERKLYDVQDKRLADPRVTHSLTLQVDRFGNVLRSAAIGYGRRHDDPDPLLKQKRTHVTFTQNEVTNDISEDDAYRTPLPCESRTYELLKASPVSPPDLPVPGVTNLFRFEKVNDVIDGVSDGDHDLLYEDWDVDEATLTQARRRLIEHVRTLYRANDLSGPEQGLLPLKQLRSLALPGESYKLAFTPGLLAQSYKRKLGNAPEENLLPNPASVLEGPSSDRGGYQSSQSLRSQNLFPANTADPLWTESDKEDHWWVPSGRAFFSPNTGDTPAQELAFAQAHFFLPHRFRDPFGHTNTVTYDSDDQDPAKNHNLLLIETRDALGNAVRATHDYRVLQPKLMTDPNGNRAEVAFDALGMVAGTAVKGKDDTVGDTLSEFNADPTQPEIDQFYDAEDPHVPAPNLLKGATTRIIYDLDRFRRTRQAHPTDPTQWLPVCAATLARETHVSDPVPPDGLKIQISFSYSDGFGREIQKKIQAEPGAVVEGGPVVSPRWVGSGWTIFNNKGKPVRQYEPFFSQLPAKRHQFEFGVEVGVSPVLFYDPVERVFATLHPNHTYEKMVFDPWRQITWDVNDTVLNADGSTDPKSDEAVKGFFSRLPDADYLPTWYEQRIALAATDPERVAANKAAVHRQTPTVAHLDTLGRTFLTIAHNRFERNDAIVEESYPTRVELDIEGNQRAVRDAVVQNGGSLGRIVMRYDYDMLGNRIHQASMEAGERWMLNDVTGKPIRVWDSRGHNFTTEYDPLRRPLSQFVRGTHADRSDPRTLNQDVLFDKTEYGEGQTDDVALNLRTRVFKRFDGAGVVTSMGRNLVTNQDEAYDFKGNLLRSSRQLLRDYQALADWQQNPALEQETFTSSTTYDALNRPTAITAPDRSTYRPTYNEANLLDKIDVNLRGAATATPFVTNIDYDAKGQRTRIDYGNGTRTDYEYDKETFRLIHLNTLRGGTALQDLRYTYDPVGNITSIRDDAQQTIYFNGQVVEPHSDYTYDAIYRLLEAKGREHIGQLAQPETTWNDEFRVNLLHRQDGQAMRSYTEEYQYDAVGNFERLIHQAANGNWTRAYTYNEASLIEPAVKKSNRLSSTTVGQTTEAYAYDAHGNMTAIPHLTLMQWDFKDQLRATSSQVLNNGTPETTFYVYDASGQRARKVTERQSGTRKNERVYLGGFEVYREYNGTGAVVTLERETLHVMDDKQRIALVETKTVENGNPVNAPVPLQRYQLANHLGSASLELDRDGGLISYEEYHPYGTTAYQAMNSAAEVSLKRYRYTGKERDEETGFTYHGARYYAPWLGRWAVADPIGIGDGLNLYVYAKTNPLILRDPSGTENKPITENDKTIMQMKDPQLYRYLKNLEQRSPERLAEFAEHTTGWFRRRAEGMINKYGMVREYPLTITGDKPEQKRPDPGEVKDDPHVAEAFIGSVKKTQLDFGISHPLEALAMGRPGGLDEKREVSITAAAYRLSSAATGAEDPQFNAVRHAIWMAQSTAEFGEEIAREAGYAHEGEIPDLTLRVVKYESASEKEGAKLKADTIADLLNNVLGRKIGKQNPGVFSKEMSLRVLEYYHSHGLYEVKETAGGYSISQNKLEPEAYKRAVEAINALEEEGLTAQELENLRQRE